MTMNATQIIAHDRLWKDGTGTGMSFDFDAKSLLALFEGRSRLVVRAFIEKLQLGDKSNPSPPSPNLTRRLIEQLTVVYRTPPTRRLKRGRVLVEDEAPDAIAVADAYKRSRVDTAMRRADHLRTLLRQCVVVLCENHELKRVTMRVHPPQNVFRVPCVTSADCIDQDTAVAILLDGGVYEVWNHDAEGWVVTIENDQGEFALPPEEQPYAETGGRVPFGVAPFVMLYDEDPVGRAWLPIDQSMLDSVLNVAAMYCDVVYLVAMETWTLKVAIGLDPYAAPTQGGPGKIISLPKGGDVKLLAHSPQIDDATRVIQEVLSGLALAAGLAPNAFALDRVEQTGAALRAAERFLDARRVGQVPMAQEAEIDLYRKFAAIHNANAGPWGRDPLPVDVELACTFAEPSIPSDPEQDQRVAMVDLQAGLASPVAYIQKKYGVSREQAFEILKSIPQDRVLVGWTPNAQPAGAAIAGGGPNAALGPASATKDPAATNLDPSSNNEQASAVGSVASGQGGAAHA